MIAWASPWVRTDYGGAYPVIWLGNDHLRLGVVPELGGRLLSMSVDGREALWRNAELLDEALQPVNGHQPSPTEGDLGEWINYGGDKTWPAPQGWSGPGEWDGPPDPVLDSGPYAYRTVVHEDEGQPTAEAIVTSGHDTRTGLTVERRFSVSAADTAVRMSLTGTNTGTEPVTWALWNVTQLVGGGEVTVQVTDSSCAPTPLIAAVGVPTWSATGTREISIPAQDVVGKLGFRNATGAMRYRLDDLTVSWTFEVDTTADYPDLGSRIEVWLECPQSAPIVELGNLDPPARIVECEILGPLRRLAPGESMTLNINMTPSTTGAR